MKQTSIFLTVKETANILRIQRAKVYLLIEEGTLEAVKIGATWRVKLFSVERLTGPLTNNSERN
jgi:excisionase family DNA binding protein